MQNHIPAFTEQHSSSLKYCKVTRIQITIMRYWLDFLRSPQIICWFKKRLNRSFDHIIHILSLLSSTCCVLRKDNDKYDKILLLIKHLVSLVFYCLIFYHARIWYTHSYKIFSGTIWKCLGLTLTFRTLDYYYYFFFLNLVVRFHQI